jgi:hypothetical protein
MSGYRFYHYVATKAHQKRALQNLASVVNLFLAPLRVDCQRKHHQLLTCNDFNKLLGQVKQLYYIWSLPLK